MTFDPNAKTRITEEGPDPFVGKTIDGLRVESVIGAGGMGTVYKATQLSLGRPVALKILPEHLAQDPQFLERFHREADALSRLSHPNIVTVYDRGETDGRPYLVMEFVEGYSLRELMRSGPVESAEASRIATKVLRALGHAHGQGIVHRDIKPENVLLAHPDVVKVADFGLSRLLGPDEQTRLTRTHLVLGTFEYMAPEQRERAREADERSDLFAVGVVLYEMLTGELPIGRFDLPSQRRPGHCDARIDKIVARSLEKDPERRYQSARDMAQALTTILDRPAHESVPPPPRPATAAPKPKPGRFDYHLDIMATINEVLGIGCYVLAGVGFLATFVGWFVPLDISFGVAWLLIGGFSWGFLLFVGWLFRFTGKGLRRHTQGARVLQTILAILLLFGGVLLPAGIYYLWVLFAPKHRHYYDARTNGLSQAQAEDVAEGLAPRPAPAPAPPPRPVTPSQIPVQSTVTSRVLPPRPPRSRRVGLVIGLFVCVAFLGILATGLLYVSRSDSNSLTAVASPLPPERWWNGSKVRIGEFSDPSYFPLGRMQALLTDRVRMGWVEHVTNTSLPLTGTMSINRVRRDVYLRVPNEAFRDRRHLEKIAYAVAKLIEELEGGRFRVTLSAADIEFASRIKREPPP
ncbi:MAG: protein kinase [Planctomycetota bacterium]|nr:protein kinase [Planctomycetota bacterium]